MKHPVIQSLTLQQCQDTCGSSDDVTQEITITLTESGGGCYAVLETKRWAIDSGDELREIADRIDKLRAEYDANCPFLPE